MLSIGKKNYDEGKFEVEVISHNDKEVVEQLLCLEERCLPLEMRNPVGYEYFSGLLKNPNHINLLLRYKGKIVGLLVAKEYEDVYDSLSSHDPDLRHNKKKLLYIDVIQIHPRFKINGGLSLLIKKLIEKAMEKNLAGFCIHARQKNGLSQFLQNMLHCKRLHSIDNWLGFGEQFDYLEFIASKNVLRKIMDKLNPRRVFGH